ncbi:(R)-mandelonitrile lyase-like [Hibiscus syriacus]|uniref:(R)-mandelonitrile lyase-like n=1 Tax=Hibiscus syriacus TaxID=106335 RepID=A0A6A3ACB0_HIBSY|nr:(R)-mandelonitrile lyase-like [Hibiscus syriacus]
MPSPFSISLYAPFNGFTTFGLLWMTFGYCLAGSMRGCRRQLGLIGRLTRCREIQLERLLGTVEFKAAVVVRDYGCPLAATLSQIFRVLVLERGSVPYGNQNLMNQEGFLTAVTEVDTYDSPAQTFTSEDGVLNARGWVLGGSNAINARMLYLRQGSILTMGIDPHHGFSLEHFVGTKIGGSTFDRAGKRHSATDLLNYEKPANIRVSNYASVERVLLVSSSSNVMSWLSVIGVVFRDEMGRYHHAMVKEKGKVLLCAGAIGIPQLLLLIGIGPRPYLSSWGIPVVYHHPNVEMGAYLEAASNVISFTTSSCSVFVRPPSSPLLLTVATIMEKIVGPISTGSLRLASTDVRVNPIVRFNYLNNHIDLESYVNGTRKIEDILRSRSMDDFKFIEWFGGRNFRFVGLSLPVDQSNYEMMADFYRRTVSTIWHYHGGCVVGRVVDQNYHVTGIDALRVVDGSTFTISLGTNPQATVMMLGRYVGMRITK